MSSDSKKKRKTTTEEKKRLILHAAVRVFAQKGFHRCRISDIATEADVAYGLVYHYFKNKEAILNSIFDKNWGLLSQLIDTVEQETGGLEHKLRRIASFILDAYQLVPDIIQVMVMEIARSSKFLKRPKIEAFERAFVRLAEVLEQHQERGEIKPELDPKFMAYAFFGIIELVLTGYLLGTLQPGQGEDDEFKSHMVSMFLDGIRTT